MRTKVTLVDGTYINYTYDGLSRLASESKSDPSGAGIYNAAYQYDNVGNRLNYSKTDYHGFNDDFNRVNSLDAGGLWNETTGDWQIDNNRLFMPNAETDAVIIYSGQDIANPVIETMVRLETVGNKKGSYIVFGYQSRNDFYYAGLEGISDLWVMGHYQDGVYNDLITFSQPIEKLIDYHLKVTVKDNVATLENLENGVWVKKLSNNFGSLPTGKVGLSVEKSRTQFDDFKITWQSTSNTVYSYNQGNQLTQSIPDSQSTSYSYDRNGNLTQKIEGINSTEYAYDYANRLLNIIASGSEAIYTYDGLGKRISKTVNGQLTKYVYDSANIIFAQTPQESITYTHSLAIDNPVSMRGELTGESYYHSDGLGSITNLTNSAGQSVQDYQYDAFGNMLSSQGSISNPYAYTAREVDSETGLYYYRNRYYDPQIGRFITQDPIGILDDINLYAYVGNSPVNFVDPWGLFWEKKFNNSKERARNMDKSVSYLDFVNYAKNKTLLDLQNEMPGNGSKSGAGGPALNRYVIDPANSSQVIDMRHFLVVGPQGETAGLLIEILQKIQGLRDTAFDAQDFLSNYLGNEFYKKYYDPTGNLDEQLKKYFEARKKGRKCKK